VNAVSLKLNSETSSFKRLNNFGLDEHDQIKYYSPISKKGNKMTPGALEYANNKAKISITGGNKHKRKIVKNAARWMLGYTLGPRLANNITLKINITEKLKDSNVYGSVIWDDDNHRPREYDMELCNYLKDSILYRILAHEIVHIRQYATGDLKDLATHANYCKWKNTMVQSEGRGSGSYFDLPWEIEARKQQGIILGDWKRAYGYRFRQKTGELYNE